MAWGAPRGIDDLVARVAANDVALTALALMPGRRVDGAAAAALFQALAGNTVLTELHVGGRPLDAAAAAALGDALRARSAAGVPPLTALAAGDAAFGCAGVAAVAPGLVQGTRCADLEARGVGVAGAAALAAALTGAAAAPALRTLRLARNPLGDAGAAALAPALAHLRTLDASACGVGDAGAAALAAALPGAAATTLTLAANPLGAAGAAALAGALAAPAAGLVALSLAGCAAVGDGGAASLAAALARGAALTSLDLAGCGLTDAGVIALADALAGSALAGLSVRGVAAGGEAENAAAAAPSFSSTGARALGRALANPACPLRSLDAGCAACAEPEAVAALAGPRLTSLTLSGTRIADAGAAALAAALTSASDLRTLDVAACGIGIAGVAALVDAVTGGAAPALAALVVGGNPAADDVDAMGRLAARLREARPGVDVVWRVADTGDLKSNGREGG